MRIYNVILVGDRAMDVPVANGEQIRAYAAAVNKLAELLGISMEHVYCAGDEANDVSMLTAAKEGFAPANCAPVVRACGATLVSHAEEGTIADIIRILDERY